MLSGLSEVCLGSNHLTAPDESVSSAASTTPPMKYLLAVLLLGITTATLADSPAQITTDYRKQASAAIAKVNDTLEKATVPLVAALLKAGDTEGAEILREQMKSKIDGDPVIKPHASAVALFSSYDTARLKAVESAQKAAIARIDSMLASSEGKKMEVLTELGKVRAEVEAGQVGAATAAPGNDQLYIGKSWYTKPGSEYHFNKDGTGYRLQKGDYDGKVPFTWTLHPDGIVEVQQRRQPTAPTSAAFFRFVDKKTAFQGTSKTAITAPLSAGK